MRKYLTILKLSIKEYFAYRLSFILWRVRMFLSILITFFLWNSVFDKNASFAHYGKGSMLSYILFANVISNFVLGTRTTDIASEINDGTIINYLLKPLAFFKYYLTKDIADKLLNTFFVFFEMSIIIFLFKPPLIFPTNLLMALIFLVNGVFISFFINLILSFIGFWTNEVWAPRFLFIMLVSFLSGSFFPLDILPQPLFLILIATPFPYLFYLPTKFLLGDAGVKPIFIYLMIFFSFLWLFLSWQLAKFMWNKGLKTFSFWGR